jgi:adenylate cyclase
MQSNYLVRRVGAEASYSRLERLILQRLEPGADKEQVDAQIWDLFGEEWAILFTDLSGFSRQVAEYGIIHFLQTIFESERILVPLIEQHGGILLKTEGDSMLITFRNVERALQCAIDMQKATVSYNHEREESEKVLLCAGLGYGRVLRIGDSDVFGAEVNAASKLGEDLATAGEILATEAVRVAINARAHSNLPMVMFEKVDVSPSGADTAYRIKYT